MFTKTLMDTVAMGGGTPYDVGTSGGGAAASGGWLGLDWLTEVLDKAKDTAFLSTMGITPDQIKQIQYLDKLGILTPTLAQKLLFGEGASGGGSQRMVSDDPRYWDLQYKQLEQQYINMGLDAESARRQALTTLITNRNHTAVDVANTSASIAKTKADYAANPRDAVAELIYRNQVGGVTPFADTANNQFGEYGKTLAEKGVEMFSGVDRDLNQARLYRDAIPQTEFYGPETRAQLGLSPTAAQGLAGGTGTVAPAAGTPAPAPLDLVRQQFLTNPDALQGFQNFANFDAANTGQALADQGYTSPDPGVTGVRRYAEGGKIDFGGIFEGRSKDGFSPSSSEGGTNLNIHERAIIVGESGQIYGTLGEKRPDGSIRAEQLQIKPLKSEVEKDKKLADAKKAQVETQQQTLKAFAHGGTATATPDDFMQQLSDLLSTYGGAGGGTATPLGGTRHLAGAPANALLADPVLKDYTEAAYSAKGIDPRTLWADIEKFSPQDAMRRGQTTGRVNFL